MLTKDKINDILDELDKDKMLVPIFEMKVVDHQASVGNDILILLMNANRL